MRWILLLCLVLVIPGCINVPDLESNARCTAAGTCPQGYECSADLICQQLLGPDAQGDDHDGQLDADDDRTGAQPDSAPSEFIGMVVDAADAALPPDMRSPFPGVLNVAPARTGLFGAVTVGQKSALVRFTLSNGTDTVQVLMVGLTGANRTSFTITGSTCKGSLIPGAACTVDVQFVPTATGVVLATLSFGPVMATLDGTGKAAPVRLSVNPTSLSFGDWLVGTSAPALPITITNGDTQVVLAGVTNAGDFFAPGGSCGSTLAPNASCTRLISFRPGVAGDRLGSYQIYVGGPAVSFSGRGIAATLTVAPPARDFGTWRLGDLSPEFSFTIANNTGTRAGAFMFQAAGPAAMDFVIRDIDCVTGLAPGATCAFGARFSPQSVGAKVNRIVAGPALPDITLSGTGTQSPVPIVRLKFDENMGFVTENSGSAGGRLTLTQTAPIWTTNIPAGVGGTSAVDFGTATGIFGLDSEDLIPELGGLKQFTITGWVNNRRSIEGGGGDRLVTWINDGGQGVDLVYKANGSLQIGINHWPDGNIAGAQSSAGKVTTSGAAAVGNWVFFAVTYDSALPAKQVQFFFGTQDANATLDVPRDYDRGPVGKMIGPLAIGNFNRLTAARNDGDRMFRGIIDDVRIFGDVLTRAQIVAVQKP